MRSRSRRTPPQAEACASMVMDSRKQGFHSKRVADIACERELRTSRAAHNDLVAYEIHSQQDVGNRTRLSPSHNQDNGVAARSHRRLPIAHGSDRAISEDALPPEMLMPSCGHFDEHMRSALIFGVPHPPVTTATLIELDLNWILHNMNLRSDINFDSDLHFKPVKGKRAEQKQREAQEYWLALAAELQIHLHARLGCPPSHHIKAHCAHEGFAPRLRQMFTDLRELLETLIPDRDHVSIAENLDVPFVMQQIENGVLDISRLANWLASLIKSHCAPMRDTWADQMTMQIEEGAQKADMILLVKGIENLFSVLEAMKLDVANHQIRTFRFRLMEDTISFQQEFFSKKIMDGKVDPGSCRDWYDGARQWHSVWLSSSRTAKNLDAYASLIHGMIATFFVRSGTCALPRSFQFDLKRLERLRTDMRDLVHLKAALLVFDELRSWLAPRQPTAVPSDTYAELQSRFLAIVDEQPDEGEPWQTCSADVALEITRAACEVCGHSQTVVPDCLIQCTLLRWNEMVSGQTPQSTLIWESLQEDLTSRAIYHAQIFNDMTPLAMSEAQYQWQQQQERKSSFRPLPEVEDIARRVAHVGILHWKIWANLVYLDDREEALPGLGSLTNAPSGRQTGDRARKIPHVLDRVAMVAE